MYRLMKSEKRVVDLRVSGLTSSYRQTTVEHFPQLQAALGACRAANSGGASRHYLLNETGQEYYDGTWID